MRMDELDERLAGLAEEGARNARPPAPAAIRHRSRRRRRRQAAGVVLLGLALVGAVVVARASSPVPSGPVTPTPTTQAPATPGGIVPWSSAPPRPPAPARPAAVPPGTPACTADRLHATAGWEGATGSLVGSVRFTSRGGAVCALNGYPTIQLLDQHGRALPTRTGRSGRSQATGVLVRPGTAATAAFVWSNWCGPNPGRVGLRVTLPGGGTLVPTVEAGTPRELTARCDAPGAPSSLSRGPFAAERPEPPPSPLEGLTATIGLPPTVVAGRPLRYTVTLANPTERPVSLRDCPSYMEAVLLRNDGKAVERHLLNCAPVGAIGPGQRVTFAMVLDLPARLRPGAGVLTWVMESVGVGTKVPVTVTGP
ncbi:MAG TPA: DUF4232 domain-containing protein [Actinomycetes bacterium]|jgi:hypothetical protein|nr:DUF4232 domain-containing protein [Actinomycetes bacterium]